MSNELMTAIEGIGKSFEDLRKTQEKQFDEERKGNTARAAELQGAVEKINETLGEQVKNRDVIERRLSTQQDRLEILEALNDRPRATIQDKIRSEHKDLFVRWLRSKGTDQGAVNDYEALRQKAKEVKDVSLTDAAGGFAVPEEISRSIDKLILAQSAIAANVKNVQVGTSDYKELININGTTYAWAAETDSRTAKAEPTLRQITPTWGELYTYLKASNWSIEDIFFSVDQWLVDNASEGFAVGLSTGIYNGAGSGALTGMVNATPVVTNDDGTGASPEALRAAAAYQYIPLDATSPVSTSVTADSLISLVYKLKAGYRANAKFAMNSVTQGFVRKLKDDYGQYLWQPSFQAGQPDRLLGYEVFSWENLGNANASNAYAVMFGDFRKAYTLATRAGMSIVRENVTAPGFTNFYISRRYGGIVANNDALKILKVAAS